MKTVAIIQARMGSSRLPGKVLTDIGGKPALAWTVRVAKAIPGIDSVVIATSTETNDDVIAEWCTLNDTDCFRGSEDDVLARYAAAAEAFDADVVMRLTADCPLLDPRVCGQVAALLKHNGADYACNNDPATFPDGLCCEALTMEALMAAHNEARRPSEREHVTLFVINRRQRFRTETLTCPLPGLRGMRWTLDTEKDLDFLRTLAEHLPDDRPASYFEVLEILDRNPEIATINAGEVRDEGYLRSLEQDRQEVSRDYETSRALLERALRVIPLGSQTFSKSHVQFPKDSAPLFLTHGDGGMVWDVDGNEYVDMVCGLMPVVLGYRDQDIDAAIHHQLAQGISFSLATHLETELAERLVEIVPCAEMVRFGKNGTDATSAAIRLARAATGRDRIATCGYHGWQDWSIGTTTRNKGIPQAVQALTHTFPYDDLDAVDRLMRQHPGEFAALILEPMNAAEPSPGYLEHLKELVHRHGALLIFDEIITGFRFALGGAQELFGVTPDLATFGKGLGNGMPISAVVGRADLMREMEEIFFSGTFSGETLSLAAAIAVIDKMRREPVIETLWRTGERLTSEVQKRIAAHGLEDVFSLSGKAPWMVIRIDDHPEARKEATRTLFIREMLGNGALVTGVHSICYAHTEADIAIVLDAYDAALPKISEELASGALEERLGGPAIEPVFEVRPSP